MPSGPARGAGTDAVLAVACAVAAGALVAWYTHPGLLTSNDSATYLSTAQHLVSGKGITAGQQPTNSEVRVSRSSPTGGAYL